MQKNVSNMWKTVEYAKMSMVTVNTHRYTAPFFPKIVAQNQGCSLSAGTCGKGAVNLRELTLYG